MGRIVIADFPIKGMLDKVSGITLVDLTKQPSLVSRLYSYISRKSACYSIDNSQIESLCKNDCVVLFDTNRQYYEISKRIEEKVTEGKLIFYAWNPLTYSHDFDRLSTMWKKWTFSKADMIAPGFKYGGTFYPGVIVNNDSSNVYDGFFIGLDKGRGGLLDEIENLFLSSGFTCLIKIVDNRKAFFYKRYSRYKKYSQIVDYIKKSNSLIEIVQEGQEGLTLRSMEALFYRKKLITNNKSIKNYDFYNADNIFIFGEDDINSFSTFMRTPYRMINKQIINYYVFSSWLKRITGDDYE